MKRPRPRLLLVLPLFFCACASTEEAAPSNSVAQPMLYEPLPPWTQEFLEDSLLIAEQIRIEGPPGLIQHFAARCQEEFHERREETLPEGYLQEIRVRADGPLVEARGYLDRLELVVTRSITMLERPGECDVVVVAIGDVLYSHPARGESRRSESLRLIGKRPASR